MIRSTHTITRLGAALAAVASTAAIAAPAVLAGGTDPVGSQRPSATHSIHG